MSLSKNRPCLTLHRLKTCVTGTINGVIRTTISASKTFRCGDWWTIAAFKAANNLINCHYLLAAPFNNGTVS
jgi:hypothetical protein